MGDDTPCFYSDWYYTEESENLWEKDCELCKVSP